MNWVVNGWYALECINGLRFELLIAGRSLPARGAWIETIRALRMGSRPPRRSPRGERGLKHPFVTVCGVRQGRSPRGERGLKRIYRVNRDPQVGRSPRGERGLKRQQTGWRIQLRRRSPRGERGLKQLPPARKRRLRRRSPRGERGLKRASGTRDDKAIASLPARGAWIETLP